MIETANTSVGLNTIEEALEDLRQGKVIIVVDDENRENEGDFICAAEKVTPEVINFMAMHGRGLICTPITEDKAKQLELNMMVSTNTALHETAFTVSIDLIGRGCSTGISAYDRSTGIQAILDPEITASDFARPGHIFPLVAKNGGVLRRTGHTEAAVDLAAMAGFKPAGVLVEILNEDGSMARLPELEKIAEKHQLKIISIEDLIAYRLEREQLVEEVSRKNLSTKYGDIQRIEFKQLDTNDSHTALVIGNWEGDDPVLVRVHSNQDSVDLMDLLLSKDKTLMQSALEKIAKNGNGVLLIMRPSDKGELEYTDSMSQRDFGIGAQILRSLNIQKIRLLTNNPRRRVGLIGYDLEIVENITFS